MSKRKQARARTGQEPYGGHKIAGEVLRMEGERLDAGDHAIPRHLVSWPLVGRQSIRSSSRFHSYTVGSSVNGGRYWRWDWTIPRIVIGKQNPFIVIIVGFVEFASMSIGPKCTEQSIVRPALTPAFAPHPHLREKTKIGWSDPDQDETIVKRNRGLG